DTDLRRGDRHHGQSEDLACAVVPVPRHGDEGEVASVQHQLEGEQHDEQVAPDKDSESADPEQEGGHGDIPGDARPKHQRTTPASGSRSCAAPGPVVPGSNRRVCAPRITPPTAATSRTIDVISKASRWSTRKVRPIHAGVPKAAPTSPECERLPPACRPTATTISTRRAPAATTPPTVCQLGPPDQGVSRRGPTYAITNRNMTTTAPAYTSTWAAATNSAESRRYMTASEARFPISASAE